jgi:glycosyltransferase involved in cell wall biosynthesis
LEKILVDLSIIIPVYNEQENLPYLYKAILDVTSSMNKEWELIFINDGSQDKSLTILADFASANPENVRVISFRRNFGQTAAISAGIDHSQGDIVVMLDADMQNDPVDIPLLLDKLSEGYDVVSGWRINRQDKFITRTLPSRIANGLISWVTGVHLHDYGCTLKAYRREVITGFRLYGEMHRFIPVYANSVGARITEVPVHHHPRRFGKAKYGLERTFKVVLDLFVVKFLNTYAGKPIYLFGGVGAILILVAIAVMLFLLVRRVWFGVSVFDSPFFQMSTMIFILGFQSLLMGLIAELLVRTYHESQGKPSYTVSQTINLPETYSPETESLT